MNIYIKKSSLVSLVLTLLSISNFTNAQFYPHEDNTDYKEDYRPQFHFSPKSEWMNDINGLVYQGGKYHMIYQWGKAIRHGGYATSPDLLHWEDKGVALIPQKTFLPADATPNVLGAQVYSGSAVVVSKKIAKKITGSRKEAIIAIYTGTEVGTCLAWSNDNGEIWHNYHNNPVAHATEGAVPRDPCVIWHEASQKWILGIFEKIDNKNYTAFYGSKDLIKWNFLSKIKFGFECPDLFELPLDRDTNNMKWVLHDANGTYLIGQFDGKEFKPDLGIEEGSLLMDKGPDFYAGQTFYPHNMPEKKIIQIAWNDHWNGGVGEQIWERNATFPVEVGLVTYEGKAQVTRIPIAAISKLYTNTTKFANKTLTPGNNILSGIKSKAFDMTAEFDLNNTTAKTIKFTIANKSYTYKIAEQKFEGAKIRTIRENGKKEWIREGIDIDLKQDASGRLKIRMLIDWSTVEVFANKGVFSYSEHFALDPKANNVEINVDGEVKLTSLEFNQIKSIWK